MRFLFTLLLFYSLTYTAQSWEWAKHYGGEKQDYGQAIGTDKNGNLYVCGDSYYVTGGSCQGCYNKGIFYKLDKQGNLLWNKTNLYFGPKQMVTDEDGNSYMTWGGRLIKFDKDGNQLWLLSDSAIGFRTVALHPKGGVAISGSTYNEKGIVARIDGNGSKIWEDKRDFYSSNAGNISVDKSGNIYYSGGYKKDTAVVNKGICVRLDDQGKLLSFISIPSTAFMKGVEDGIYMIAAGPFESESGIEPGDFTYHLIKYSFSGKFLWHNKISSSKYGPKVFDMTIDDFDNVIITGNYFYTLLINGIELSKDGYINFYMTKFSKTGVVLWHNSTSDNNGVSVDAMGIVAHANDILMTGYMYCGGTTAKMTYGSETINGADFNSYVYSDMFVGKFTADLSIGIVENKGEPQSNLLLYPNPTGGAFNLTIKGADNGNGFQIKIVNILGSIIYSEEIRDAENPTRTIDLSGFSRAAYFVTVSGDQFTETKKIILR